MNSEIESLMAEHAAAMAEDKTNETDVNDVEMANTMCTMHDSVIRASCLVSQH